MKVVLVLGLPGSGKSYFASRLASEIHAEYVNSDLLRKSLFAIRTYTAQEKEEVYKAMRVLLDKAVSDNKSIVLDATFYQKNLRQIFIDTAKARRVPVYMIEVVADEAIISRRLQRKREDSEADFAVYVKVRNEFEPVEEEHLTLQSEENNLKWMIAGALKYLDKRIP